MDSDDPRDTLIHPARRQISQNAYRLTVLLSRCDELYGQGRFEELAPLIDQAWVLAVPLPAPRRTEESPKSN